MSSVAAEFTVAALRPFRGARPLLQSAVYRRGSKREHIEELEFELACDRFSVLGRHGRVLYLLSCLPQYGARCHTFLDGFRGRIEQHADLGRRAGASRLARPGSAAFVDSDLRVVFYALPVGCLLGDGADPLSNLFYRSFDIHNPVVADAGFQYQ